MWTDINMNRELSFGLSGDMTSFAIRCSFRPPNWVPESVSILPIPRDWVAAQECVGDNTKGPKLTAARPAAKVRFAVDVEAHAVPTTEPTKQDQRAPIKMVSGLAWSPGIYQALRLLGEKPRCSMGEGVYSPSHF